MKNLAKKALFGGNNIVSGCVALAVVMSIALGCNCNKDFDLANLGKSEPSNSASNSATNSSTDSASVPSNSVVEGLVKETIEKFSDGVETGDFTELHEYSSTNFRRTYTVEQVAEGFKSYTDKKKIVVPILKKVDAKEAEFDRPPIVRQEKGLDILVASGKFATKPYGVRFDFEYVMLGGEWKLLKLVINIP
ncbi:MAG: hypothetical protein KBF83_07310 [Pyrinomonadaceae bacterium]|nr:hypothetical protein [Acidobacteriota bacterium]MBP7475301.1 hypothetical protein [Pyrinomonadaceae bacterium]MBP9109348.1 hypothetical protein [Pyrinomonadaceae bacterium]